MLVKIHAKISVSEVCLYRLSISPPARTNLTKDSTVRSMSLRCDTIAVTDSIRTRYSDEISPNERIYPRLHHRQSIWDDREYAVKRTTVQMRLVRDHAHRESAFSFTYILLNAR